MLLSQLHVYVATFVPAVQPVLQVALHVSSNFEPVQVTLAWEGDGVDAQDFFEQLVVSPVIFPLVHVLVPAPE